MHFIAAVTFFPPPHAPQPHSHLWEEAVNKRNLMQYIIISPEQPHIHRTLLSTSARLMDLLKLLKVEQAARVCQLENLHQRATPASTATDQGVAVQRA